ncbi:hypothetical protein BH11PLA1_BH11PLA1_02440 [soil metagenome]
MPIRFCVKGQPPLLCVGAPNPARAGGAIASTETVGTQPPPLATAFAAAAPVAAAGVAARIRRGPLFDAGWIFIASGLALIAATVLIPAQRDLETTRVYQDRMEVLEQRNQQRLQRYTQYAAALDSADPDLVRSLASVQLNMTPVDTQLLEPSGDLSRRSASPFASLEPPPAVFAEPPKRVKSTLEQWATDEKARLWLLAAGAMCILVGLLPTARR